MVVRSAPCHRVCCPGSTVMAPPVLGPMREKGHNPSDKYAGWGRISPNHSFTTNLRAQGGVVPVKQFSESGRNLNKTCGELQTTTSAPQLISTKPHFSLL